MKIFIFTLFAAAFAQNVACKVCEKAAGILKNQTDNIQVVMDKVCMKLNGTAHELECKLAVKTLVGILNSETAEQLCERVKLCNGTEVSETEMLSSLAMMTVSWPLMVPELTKYEEESKPEVDLCSICETAIGVVQGHTQQLLQYLDGLCKKLNNTIEKAACDEAVQVAVNVLNSQTPTQLCTEIKLCKSEETQSVKKIYQSCGSCQQMFKVARSNPELISEFDCTTLPGLINLQCRYLQLKSDYYLNNYAPDAACVNLGACAKGYISGVW